MSENEPTNESENPIESAREIYAGYLAEAQGEELQEARKIISLGARDIGDESANPLEIAITVAEEGDVLQAVFFLEKADPQEKEKWAILAQALEKSAESADRMIIKAKGRRSVIIPALQRGAEKDRKQAGIFREAIERLKIN